MKTIKLLMIFCLFFIASIYSQNADSDLVYAKRIKLNSTILGEERNILVSIPNNYSESQESYPVFYVLDGWSGVINLVNELSNWGQCSQMIVVVIEVVNPMRDMFPSVPKFSRGTQPAKPWYNKVEDNDIRVPPAGEKFGEADKFLSFIEMELFPFIEKNYRTLPYKICSGQSSGGLCVTHAFLSHLNMFNAYIALSPSLYWDDGLLLKTAAEKIDGKSCKNKQFYFSIGGKEIPSTIGDAHSFAEILSVNASPELKWKFDYQENESHASGAIMGLINGLRFIYDGWKYDEEKMKAGGINAIDNFYDNLTEKFGYKISPDVGTFNSIGWALLRNGRIRDAMKIFEENIRRNPNSPIAYNYLAEGYLKDERIDMAIKAYEKAVELAATIKNGNVEFLKRRLESIKANKKD